MKLCSKLSIVPASRVRTTDPARADSRDGRTSVPMSSLRPSSAEGAPRTPRPRGDSHEEHRADFGFLGDMRCNDPQPRRDSDRHPGPDDRDGIHTTASHTARASLVQRLGRWVPLSLGLYESRPLCLCETQRRPEHRTEGTADFTDSATGTLLLYSDGIKVFNGKTHKALDNGTDLNGADMQQSGADHPSPRRYA